MFHGRKISYFVFLTEERERRRERVCRRFIKSENITKHFINDILFNFEYIYIYIYIWVFIASYGYNRHKNMKHVNNQISFNLQASASGIQFFSKPFAFSDSSVLKQTDVVSVTATESV